MADRTEWLEKWVQSNIHAESRTSEDYITLIQDLFNDSEDEGVTRPQLDDAAGGNVRAHIRAILKKMDDNAPRT